MLHYAIFCDILTKNHMKYGVCIMEYDLKKIGRILQSARKQHDLTLEEVGERVGLAKSTVQRYEAGLIATPKRAVLEALAGAVGIEPVQLTGKVPANAISVKSFARKKAIPILGKVSAGEGAFADSNVQGYIMEDEDKIDASEEYAYLKVCGDSMYPEFKDGDMVLVQCTAEVENGSFCVVMIDDDNGVVKKVEKGEGFIILHSVNPTYPPRRFNGEEMLRIRVFGTVKGLRRSF